MQIKLFELIAWQRGTWSRWCTKTTWNKIFLWARERMQQWKIFEDHNKIFENYDAVQKQRKYGLPSIILSILWFKFNATEFTSYFHAVNFLSKSLSCLMLFSKFFPAFYASNNLSLWNNTPCVWIYYCAISLRNHRLFLIPHFDLWNLSLTIFLFQFCGTREQLA